MGGEFAEGREFLGIWGEQKAGKKEAGNSGGDFFKTGKWNTPHNYTHLKISFEFSIFFINSCFRL